jgi:hypothetical protein
VHDLSFETAETVYLGPSNVIQSASCADEHIGSVIDHLPVRSLHRDMPFAFGLVEVAACNFVSQLDESFYRELVRCGVQVGLDLVCRGIQRGPIRIRVERILVRV